MLTEWVFLGVSLLLILSCGLFVAAEFSFVTVDRSQVDRAAAEGDAGAIGVQRPCAASRHSSPAPRSGSRSPTWRSVFSRSRRSRR
jgi:hypothetical protein